MLTKKDLQAISAVVDDRLDKKLDQKFEEKLKPIKQDLKSIKRKLDDTIGVFDRDFRNHHVRLQQLEEKVGVRLVM